MFQSWLKFRKMILANARAGAVVCLALLALSGLQASAQADFTLQAADFHPLAIDPGQDTTSQITLGPPGGAPESVNLSCSVTSAQTVPPGFCLISPATVQPPGGAIATINAGTAAAGIYTITITGTGATTGEVVTSQPLNVTILQVAPGFTITVQTTMAPSSIPAGTQSQGVVNVNPVNGYVSPSGGGVTLACATISPLVTIPPICSFSYPKGMTSLPVNGATASSTITIGTFGPVPEASVARPRYFYAVWLPLPMLALAGLGASRGRKKVKAWSLLALFLLIGACLFLPACASTTNAPQTGTPNGVTPANTYTFTISGIDSNGTAFPVTGSGPPLTLTVTAPVKP